MSLKNRTYLSIIGSLCLDARENPNGDRSRLIDKLLQELHEWEHREVRNVLFSLLLRLYQFDSAALKRDLSKSAVLGGKDADPKERLALLRCLYGVLAADYPEIKNLCDEVMELEELEEGE